MTGRIKPTEYGTMPNAWRWYVRKVLYQRYGKANVVVVSS